MNKYIKLNIIAYSYCYLATMIIQDSFITTLLMFIGLLPMIIDRKCFLVIIYESFKRKKNLINRVYSNLVKLILLIEFLLFFYSLILIFNKIWDILIKT